MFKAQIKKFRLNLSVKLKFVQSRIAASREILSITRHKSTFADGKIPSMFILELTLCGHHFYQ